MKNSTNDNTVHCEYCGGITVITSCVNIVKDEYLFYCGFHSKDCPLCPRLENPY
jgi:hypothetical protein